MTFHPDTLPDLTGRVYIVTGGTSGIGYYTVYHLAKHGAHVYLCARTQSKGAAAIDKLKSVLPADASRISLLEMDHLSLSSVVSAAKHVLAQENSLHGLVNNAGIMATPFEMTADGFEAQWQTNYLAHWLFTTYLQPLLLKTAQSCPAGHVRVVNLSSSGHHFAPGGSGVAFGDTSLATASGMVRYGQSKLANVLHVKTLHKLYGPGSPSARAREGEIWVSAVHPGLVESNLGSKAEVSKIMSMLFAVAGAMGARVSADKGSWTSVFCVAGSQMTSEQSGWYFQRIAEAGWQSKLARDLALAEKLEAWTKDAMKKGGWI